MLLNELHDVCVSPSARMGARGALSEFAGMKAAVAKEVEEHLAGSYFYDPVRYLAQVRRIAFNVACNPSLLQEGKKVLLLRDEEMIRGTLVETVAREEEIRSRAFEDMLREKYENVISNTKTDNILRCRGCGSSQISWEQKQTRGADEAMTVFCSCTSCHKRWRMS